MTWRWQRRSRILGVCLLLTAWTTVTTTQAQATLAGDGLLGTYYEGENFERPVLTRRDQLLDFQWAQAPPAPGVPAEHFSVRWQGWLVPPVSGRYVLHLRIDDGLRLWLDGRQLVNEWRDQYFSDYTTAVELQAGQAYALRIEYYQNQLESRMRLAWERPDLPPAGTPPPASWRNLWGLRPQTLEREEVLSAAYLFSRNPRLPHLMLVTPAALKATMVAARLAPRPAGVTAKPIALAPVVVQPPRQKPVVVSRVTRLARPRPAALPPRRAQTAFDGAADSAARQGVRAVAQLATNQPVVISALYFEQSQARLLPATRQALDGLAAALRQRPNLHLEVQGHTDNQGSAELNRQLSQQRADVVCLYLGAHGVAPSRLLAKGYGGTQPVADNNDDAQRPRNRRVVLVPREGRKQ